MIVNASHLEIFLNEMCVDMSNLIGSFYPFFDKMNYMVT